MRQPALFVLFTGLISIDYAESIHFEEARSPWVSGKHQKSLVQKPSKTTSSAQTTKVESLDNKTLKFETTNVKTTRHVMLVDKSARDESNDIENYLVDLFLFEDSVNRNHKLVAGHEVFEAKGKNYDDYIYHSRLGAVVNAGHKTRAWNIAGMNGAAKCRGLKKLYQWFDATTGVSNITLDYKNVNNKGDRQPILMCAPTKGLCGADVPLYVYSVSGNSQKLSYFYATESNYTFAPDKSNYKLVSREPICFIYERTSERVAEDKITDPHQNLRLRNIADNLQPDTYYLLEVDFDRSRDYKRHAFNTFKTNTTNSIKDCPLEELTTFLYQPGGEGSDQDDIIFVSPTDIQAAAQNVSFKNQRSLGFGITLNHHCHSRVKYSQYYDEKQKNTYVAKDGQERGNDLPRGNVSFYSL